ncbi:MAG: terminase small subunit, Nu1 [Pseudomonadota bacterium]
MPQPTADFNVDLDDLLRPEPDHVETDLPDTVGTADLAALLDISTNRVNRLARDGSIPKLGRGQFSLIGSVQAYVKYARDNPTGRQIKDADLAAEKQRLTKAQADRAETIAARERGELVKATEVETEWAAIVTDLRAALLAVPERIAIDLGLDRETATALDEHIRQALTTFADQET